MKLYEFAQQYNQLLDLLDNEDVDFEVIADTIESIEEAFEEKAENIVKVIRQLQAEAKILKEEKERIAKLQKSKENQVERLREYLKYNMTKMGKDKIKTPICSISVKDKKPTFEVVDINLVELVIPDAVSWEVKVDKTKLNKALPSLLDVWEPEKLGVKVVEGGKSVTIR